VLALLVRGAGYALVRAAKCSGGDGDRERDVVLVLAGFPYEYLRGLEQWSGQYGMYGMQTRKLTALTARTVAIHCRFSFPSTR
jgi:hypothetical protein